MKTYGQFPLVLGCLIFVSHAIFAQPTSSSTQPVVSWDQSFSFLGNLSQTDLTGEPFSAIEESMYSQEQHDGTYQNRTLDTTHIYRDSQGRMRTEHRVTSYISGAAGESWLKSIYITDPVAGFIYRLDPENHQATRGRWNDNTRELSGDASVTGPIASTGQLQALVVTELLGSTIMEGLAVDGTRQTLTVPVGADGNKHSFNVLLETWTSPELKVVVLAEYQRSKSRNITRLTKIDRSEPNPALFHVPSDYAIKDAPAVEGTISGSEP